MSTMSRHCRCCAREVIEGRAFASNLRPAPGRHAAALLGSLLARTDLGAAPRPGRQPLRDEGGRMTERLSDGGTGTTLEAPQRRPVDPRRYFETADAQRSDAAVKSPVCLYLETTNRCNLLCTTCPRTYEELEPPADMSWALFTAHRRPAARDRARRAARRRRADAGEEPAAGWCATSRTAAPTCCSTPTARCSTRRTAAR